MANIVGLNFRNWVTNQINARQKMYSGGLESNYTPDQIVYFNQKSAFVRAVSLVDIEDTSILNLPPGDQSAGSNLATKYILHGGLSSNGSTNQGTGLRAGIEPRSDFAYGIGNTVSDRGLQPMPGITDFSIKSLNRGSLREATLNIYAYNKGQFEILSALYLRLGFYIFVEWGHSMILEGSSTSQNNTSLKSYMLNNHSPEEILKEIDNKRRSSGGNYDAMLGKIKNFSWSVDATGNYSISISIISIGDVIESLKINTTYFSFNGANEASKFKPDEEALAEAKQDLMDERQEKRQEAYENGEPDPYSTDDVEDEDIVFSERFNNDISYYLYLISVGKSLNDLISDGDLDGEELADLQAGDDKDTWSSGGGEGGQDVFLLDSELGNLSNLKGLPVGEGGKNIAFVAWEGAPPIFGYYIRLGWFLEFIEQYIIYTAESNGKKSPYIKIDYDANTNVCYSIKNQVSGDPRVCIIGNKQIQVEGEMKNLYPGMANYYVDGDLEHGKLMNIYLSFTYITKTLKALTDQNSPDSTEVGDVNLYDFLKTMMSDIQNSIGGINNFDVVYDADENTIKIIDTTAIPKLGEIAKSVLPSGDSAQSANPATFMIYGVTKNAGSFVRDFSFKSEITNKMASQISIGAAANQTGVESVGGLANLNKGFKNRVVEKISPPKNQQPPAQQQTLEEKFASQLDVWNAYLQSQINTDKDSFFSYLGSFIVDDQTEWDTELFDNAKGILKSIMDYSIQLELAKNPGKVSPQVGFIPLNANFTLDGISGIRIYERFRIQQGVLPDNYDTAVDYLIKGISHKIGSDNKWITELETLTVPSESDVAKLNINPPKLYNKTPKQFVYKEIKREDTDGGSAPAGEALDYITEGFTYPNGISLTPAKLGQTVTSVVDGETITKEYQKLIIKDRPKGAETPIKRVFIHYTAGWDARDSCIGGWQLAKPGKAYIGSEFYIAMTNPDRGGSGKTYNNHPEIGSPLVEQLFDGVSKYIYTNSSNNPQEEIGIECAGPGILQEKDGKLYSPALKVWFEKREGARGTTTSGISNTSAMEVGKMYQINKEGKVVPIDKWSGWKWGIKFTPEQIQALESTLLEIAKRKNFVGNYKFGYEEFIAAFPSDSPQIGVGRDNPAYVDSSGKTLFCHSATTDKSDMWPQKELLEMLMGLEAKRTGQRSNSNTKTEQDYAKVWDDSWVELQKILLKKDKYAGTTYLLDSASGVTDDANRATSLIKTFFGFESTSYPSLNQASWFGRYNAKSKFAGNDTLYKTWVSEFGKVLDTIKAKDNEYQVRLYGTNFDGTLYRINLKEGAAYNGLSLKPKAYIKLNTDY